MVVSTFSVSLTVCTGKDVLRSIQLGALGAFARFWLEILNSATVYDNEKLYKAVYGRPHGQGLITVSNHNSELDDPCMIATISRTALLLDSKHMRWVFCAADVCFKTAASSAFFSNGKALPLRRGGGIEQPELLAAVRKLDKGDWVHIFPEGRVFQNQRGEMGPVRAGVGKMIAEAAVPPVILPIYHLGMEKIRPIGRPPQVGHHADIIIGDPIHVDDLLRKHRELGTEPYVVGCFVVFFSSPVMYCFSFLLLLCY